MLWFSLIYCAGHAMLAAFDDNRPGFYAGLFLIALGSGGIKPLVVSFVGDQFDQSNKSLAKVVFDAFYWSINFGSFFASLLMPIFLREYGPAVAFGIPGILMGIATLVFWMGRPQYVRVPPTRGQDPHSFFNVARTALSARAGQGRPGLVMAASAPLAAAPRVLGAEARLLAGAVRVRHHLLPGARRADRLWRHRDVAAARTRARRSIPTRRSTTCARCCGSSSCSAS